MKLTPEQKQAVSQWLADGASIAEVQKRLREEFKVGLTFMETRFLIDDLGLNLKETPPPPDPDLKAAANQAAPSGTAGADAELVDNDGFGPADDGLGGDIMDAPAGDGNVTVEIDRVMRPGTTVSGSVTFSDGNSGKWALDQFGRIVFEGATPEYRPSEADLKAFQQELSAQLQRQGY